MKTILDFLKANWIILVLCFIVGGLVGRCTTEPKTETKYVKGDVIHDSVPKPYAVKVYIPAKPVLPTKPDTIKLLGEKEIIALKVDTAQIIAEYVSLKKYGITLFDDRYGKLIIKPVVQYNELQTIPYEFEPITQVITSTIERTFTPYITGSYNSFGYFGIGGGLFYNKIGVGVKYMTDTKNKGIEGSFSIKF